MPQAIRILKLSVARRTIHSCVVQVFRLNVPPQILLLSHQVTAEATPHTSPLTGHQNLCASCEFEFGIFMVNFSSLTGAFYVSGP